GVPERRPRQVLRRRHHAEAQVAREAERGKEANETDRRRGDPTGSVSRRPAGGVIVNREKRTESGEARTLVIQTAFLGDVVLTTRLLAALAERDGPVDVVTTPAAAPLLEGHPAVAEVVPYDKRGADAGLGGLWRLGRRLRRRRYARAYLPHRSLRTAALAILT